MKKKVTALVLVLVLIMSFAGCGSYTCIKCDATTTKAYYDMSADKNRVMCEECARKYWTPFPYENYRVK